VVHKVANDLNFKLEANPDKFLRFDYLQYLNNVWGRRAEMVSVKQDKFPHPFVSEVQLLFPLTPKQITDLF